METTSRDVGDTDSSTPEPEAIRAIPVFLVSLEAVMMILMLYSNGMIFLCIGVCKDLRDSTHKMIKSLAVSDSLLCVAILLDLYILLSPGAEHRVLQLFCQIKMFFALFASIASLDGACAVAVVRLVAVQFPASSNSIWYNRANNAGLALVWLHAFFITSIMFYGGGHAPDIMPCTMLNMLYPWYNKLLSVTAFLDAFICLVCYVRVFVRMRGQRKRLLPYTAANTAAVSEATQRYQRDRRVNAVLFTIVCLVIVCWMPIAVYLAFMTEPSAELLGWKIAVNLIYVNCFLNPVIYFLTLDDFRQKFIQLHCCCLTRIGKNNPSVQTESR